MFSSRGIILSIVFIFTYALVFWGIGVGKTFFGWWVWGLVTGAIAGFILLIIAYRYSTGILFHVTRAIPLKSGKYPYVADALKAFSGKYNLPIPKVYCSKDILPDFYVFGKSFERCIFVFTEGFLDEGRPEHIRAALAWTMVSANRGSLQMRTLGSVMAYIFMYPAKIADFISRGTEGRYNLLNLILLLPLAPVAALFVHLALGGKNEIYATDERTTEITGDQGYLGVTLIEISKKISDFAIDTDLALIPLFIVPPRCSNFYFSLFRPFPPIAKRINRLIKQREHKRKELEKQLQGNSGSLKL